LSKRAGILILVAILSIVALRLMSSWLRWLLIAVVAGALFHLLKSRPWDPSKKKEENER
jgi:hypothetical protein